MSGLSRQSIVAGALYLLLIAGSARPQLLLLLIPPHQMPPVDGPQNGLDRKPLRLRRDGGPDELSVFLRLVRFQVVPGRTVALVLAPPHDGFSYAYWRGNYELSARTVQLPPAVIDPARADYVAAWHSEWSDPSFELVWEGFGGKIWRRRG